MHHARGLPLRRYGAPGRERYLRGFVPLDTAFPFFGGVLNAFITGWLYKITRGAAGPWRLIWVPLASWLLDWTENAFFVTMVLGYPAQPTKFAWAGYAVSLSKLATLAASFLIIGVMAIRALPHVLKRAALPTERLLDAKASAKESIGRLRI